MQGDIVGLLDSAGGFVVEYKYDAWGRPVATTGSKKDTLGKLNPFRYRGYVYDEETGLYYLRSRYYNPVWGRFVNADTRMGWSSLMGKNLFSYCCNAPVVCSDSNGFSPEITPSPSRPENWDTDFYARMLRQKIQAKIKKAAKTIANMVKSAIRNLENASLVRKASQLAQHGGGVIEFSSGLKATCYTSEYWYKMNRPQSDGGKYTIDAGIAASGRLVNKVPFISKISPYLEGIGIAMLAIDGCVNMQVDQINRCIDSAGSIGWISWERSSNTAPMPTAWDSNMFTPGEWFGEIESVEFFE